MKRISPRKIKNIFILFLIFWVSNNRLVIDGLDVVTN